MKALWHISKHKSEIRTIADDDSKGNRYRSSYSMISIGTELKVASGSVDNAMYKSMGVPFMDGDFDLPIKYGYSLVVKDVHDNYFHLLHPHQDEICVSSSACFALPPEVPAKRAALISNLETVINAYWDGNPQAGEKIAICGFGNIGSLLAVTLKDTWGFSPKIIETKKWNCNKAADLGFELDQEETYDLIFHTSGTQQGMQYCLDHLNLEGRLVELSWYGKQPITLDLGGAFHYKRLRIISSQVSHIPPNYQNRFDFKTRKELVVRLLDNPRYDQLISHIVPFDQSASFFNLLRKGVRDDGLIWLISY